MKYCLDTSAYSAFNRGDERLKKWFHTNNDILVPLIVIGELRAGFVAGNKQKLNEQLLQRFLGMPNVQTVTLTDNTTKIFAEAFLKLRKAGTPIGTNDLWIAANCIEHGVPLLSLDSDFLNIKDLKMIKL